LLTIIAINAFGCLYLTADLHDLLTAVQIQYTAQVKHVRILCSLLEKYVKLRFVFREGPWGKILKLLTQRVDGRLAYRQHHFPEGVNLQNRTGENQRPGLLYGLRGGGA
jgi:hypothetical protein